MIEPSREQIARRLSWSDAAQGRRLFGRCQKLSQALVAESVHANPTVALRATGQPMDRGSPVSTFMTERIKGTGALSAAAYILDDHVVALSSKPRRLGIDYRAGHASTVGLT